jgi:dATP pyrophosphohydrolase
MVAVYAFRLRGGRPEFLLLKRAAGDYMGGTWQPVSGGIHEGERAWETAVRELDEEAGLRPDELFYVDTVETFYMPEQDQIVHCVVFAARLEPDAEVRLNPEHDAAEWLAAPACLGRLIWPGQRRAVREILEEIIEPGPSREHLRIPI